MNESVKCQGCSLMHIGTAKDFDVAALSVTVGISTSDYEYR